MRDLRESILDSEERQVARAGEVLADVYKFPNVNRQFLYGDNILSSHEGNYNNYLDEKALRRFGTTGLGQSNEILARLVEAMMSSIPVSAIKSESHFDPQVIEDVISKYVKRGVKIEIKEMKVYSRWTTIEFRLVSDTIFSAQHKPEKLVITLDLRPINK